MVATPRRRELALNVALRRIIRNGAPRTATSTFTRLLSPEGGRRTNAIVETRAECKNNGMDKEHKKIIKVSPISGNGFERGIFSFSEGVHILHRNTYSQHVWIERIHWKSRKNGRKKRKEKNNFKELYHSDDFQCSEEEKRRRKERLKYDFFPPFLLVSLFVLGDWTPQHSSFSPVWTKRVHILTFCLLWLSALSTRHRQISLHERRRIGLCAEDDHLPEDFLAKSVRTTASRKRHPGKNIYIKRRRKKTKKNTLPAHHDKFEHSWPAR